MEDAIFDIQKALLMLETYRAQYAGARRAEGRRVGMFEAQEECPKFVDIIAGINPDLAAVADLCWTQGYCDYPSY